MKSELLYGINTVLSLLRYNAGNRKIYEIIVNPQKKDLGSFRKINSAALKKDIPLRELDPESIKNIFKSSIKNDFPYNENTSGAQGVIARVSKYNYSDLDYDIKKVFNNKTIIVILDGVTDVGNFGSILRNCSAFGINGVIISKKRSADVSNRVSKISSGALEEIRIYRIANIVRAIEKLKKNGFWIYGTTPGKNERVKSIDKVKYYFPLAIVFGSEEKGLRKLVKKTCDFLISIKMIGSMQSLNVSMSSGIFLYKIREYQNN